MRVNYYPPIDSVSYLVDPASSHMLVSKIKPCMSKYKLLYGETADGSLKQLLFTWYWYGIGTLLVVCFLTSPKYNKGCPYSILEAIRTSKYRYLI